MMTDSPKKRDLQPLEYQAFMIRLWKDGSLALWRASAQSVETGEIKRFASVEALFTYLDSQIDEDIDNQHKDNHDVQTN